MFRIQMDVATGDRPRVWRDFQTDGGAPRIYLTRDEAEKVRTMLGEPGRYCGWPYRALQIVDGLDERDTLLLRDRIRDRARRPGPRVGDFVEFSDGRTGRFSHDWGTDIQWSPHGSFHLFRGGGVSFSGGLNPPIPMADLIDAGIERNGRFWFFHHDSAGAHRGVDVVAPCRVYRAGPLSASGFYLIDPGAEHPSHYAQSEAEAVTMRANLYQSDPERFGRSQLIDCDAWFKAREDALIAQPAEQITAEQWEDALNVMPPLAWTTDGGVQRFNWQEFEFGKVTRQFGLFDRLYLRKFVRHGDPSTYLTALDFQGGR